MSSEGSAIAKAVIDSIGKDAAIAYGVFLLAALFMNVVSAGGIVGISFKLTHLLSEGMGMMGRGRGILLVLFAFATIAVPYFWKHKFAPLAFTVPLVVTLVAFWPLYEQDRQQQQAIEAMAEFGRLFGQAAEQMGAGSGVFDNLGIGAYLVIASSLYLAVRGVMKILSRA